MNRKDMVTLISQPGRPDRQVPRQLVESTLTALHFLSKNDLDAIIYELHMLCLQPDRDPPILRQTIGRKLLEEGLIEQYGYATGLVRLNPQVQAIVLVATAPLGAGRVKIARRAEDIIKRR